MAYHPKIEVYPEYKDSSVDWQIYISLRPQDKAQHTLTVRMRDLKTNRDLNLINKRNFRINQASEDRTSVTNVALGKWRIEILLDGKLEDPLGTKDINVGKSFTISAGYFVAKKKGAKK